MCHLFHIGTMFPFEDFFVWEDDVARGETGWTGRVGHRVRPFFGHKPLNAQHGVGRCTCESPIVKCTNKVKESAAKFTEAGTQPLTATPAGALGSPLILTITLNFSDKRGVKKVSALLKKIHSKNKYTEHLHLNGECFSFVQPRDCNSQVYHTACSRKLRMELQEIFCLLCYHEGDNNNNTITVTRWWWWWRWW